MSHLKKSERKVDIWLTRILVQNGISVYATWCTIATNLNLAMVIAYRSSFYASPQTAGTVALGVIAAQIVLFELIRIRSTMLFIDIQLLYNFIRNVKQLLS
jgi:hypothetical protein